MQILRTVDREDEHIWDLDSCVIQFRWLAGLKITSPADKCLKHNSPNIIGSASIPRCELWERRRIQGIRRSRSPLFSAHSFNNPLFKFGQDPQSASQCDCIWLQLFAWQPLRFQQLLKAKTSINAVVEPVIMRKFAAVSHHPCPWQLYTDKFFSKHWRLGSIGTLDYSFHIWECRSIARDCWRVYFDSKAFS